MMEKDMKEAERPSSRIESLVERLMDLADKTPSLFTFTHGKVVILEDEFVSICNELVESQPEEIIESRKVLARRDDIVKNAHEEAQRILEVAQRRLEEMTSEQEVVRQAQREADRIIRDAELRGEQLRVEALEYVHQKLEEMERQFSGAINAVKSGKSLLEKEMAAAGHSQESAQQQQAR